MNEPLRIRVTDGPVVLRNAPDSGVNASYPLWDDIRASEFFPPGVGSAYYVVALEKPVKHANQARLVEKELIEALLLIAAAWSFSGGSHLMIDTHKLISAPLFESNAGAVEQPLLTSDALIPLEILSTYVQPPLAFAIPIAKVMLAKPKTRRLVQYYYKASIDPRGSPAWFINLYKIRDMIEKIYGKKNHRNLGIQQPDWATFERLLNNHDLRHAPKSDNSPSITRDDVEWLFTTARCWVSSHLKKTEGLIVAAAPTIIETQRSGNLA